MRSADAGTARTIVITGAGGFIGRNLQLRLSELSRFEVFGLTRASTDADWRQALAKADAVIRLAGVNRPANEDGYAENLALGERLVALLREQDRAVPVLYSSTIRAAESTPYGMSKRFAEDVFQRYSADTGARVSIARLPHVFGKWARPDYNSAVATFCHNLARDLPIRYDDAEAPLDLLYIDDLIESWIRQLDQGFPSSGDEPGPVYRTTVGEVVETLIGFKRGRRSQAIDTVGTGLVRRLYDNFFISYLPPAAFSIPITSHRDPRGSFSEVIKTPSCGQFSYFSAHPGVTRGGHYHHTKTEQFVIVHGEALFRFRHMMTGEIHELRTSHEQPTMVQSIPGWVHDVTNIGDDVMVALLWANEVFDRDHPDTIPARLS